MKHSVLIFASIAILFLACDNTNKQTQALQQENDSLKLIIVQENAEMNDLLTLMNEIDDNFQKIKAAENYLTVQSAKGGDLTPSTKDRINSDMQFLAETLTKNKEQIAKLRSQLKKGNLQSEALKRLLESREAELEEKTALIVELQQQLSQKDTRIAELDEVVTALSNRTTIQDALIEDQDASLNTAYYCFGTLKELKDEKIITGGGLRSEKVLKDDFNRNYFTRIDIRTTTQIPLQAKKAKLKSTHPAGSYEYVSHPETKELTFKILDVKEFWSLGRYLVIEVDL
jgi:chromosome segregation ATPase